MLNTDNDDPTPIIGLCFCCCFGPLILGVLGASIAYFVFGIIFLVRDSEICVGYDPLYSWCLASIIIDSVMQLMQFQSKGSQANTMATLADVQTSIITKIAIVKRIKNQQSMHLLVILALVISGGIIIYGEGVTCDNMKQTGLWIWALITFYSRAIIVIPSLYFSYYTQSKALRVMILLEEDQRGRVEAEAEGIPQDAIVVEVKAEIDGPGGEEAIVVIKGDCEHELLDHDLPSVDVEATPVD